MFSEPIVLDERDSGAPGSPIVYRAAENATPRVIGGVAIAPAEFVPLEDNAVLDRLPSRAARESVRQLDLVEVVGQSIRSVLCGPVHRGMAAPIASIANEVFLDGRPLIRSRWPNLDAPDGGLARITEIIDPGSIPRNRESDTPPERRAIDQPRGGTFHFDDARVERWATAKNAWAFGYWYHDWADEQLPIEHVNAVARQIRLGLPHRYGLGEGARFYVTNLLEELDSPEEYFIDRDRGVLYAWPPPNRSHHRLTISTVGDPLIQIKNTHHIQVIGLTIEDTRGAAIEAVNVHDLLIAGCTIRNTGTDGIVLSGTNNTIRSNDFANIGATGITVTGGNRKTLASAGNRILNNHIRGFGRVYRTYAPAIRIGGVGQLVANNRLYDAPHSAIILSGNDHLVERNEIFDVLNETGDCGAIYCGQRSTLHKNLAAVPYTKPPWSTRFPQLQTYLTEGFGRPIGSKVIGNAVFGTKLGSIADRKAVAVEDNLVLPDPPDFIRIDDGRVHFTGSSLMIESIHGFHPIPVSGIGLQVDEYRENAGRPSE